MAICKKEKRLEIKQMVSAELKVFSKKEKEETVNAFCLLNKNNLSLLNKNITVSKNYSFH